MTRKYDNERNINIREEKIQMQNHYVELNEQIKTSSV